ncbi:MAG: glycyl-radical enzyme activating protein [Promethearchaeota archaeon]
MGNQLSGIVFDIKKFAIHDGPGIRTTIFLKGCPLSCWWCHNPESQQLEPQKYLTGPNFQEIIGKTMNVAEVMNEILKDRIFYDESDGGVTFSGGEPFMQPKYLAKLLDECKKQGLHTVVDTSGYVSWEILEPMLSNIDLFLYDLKLIDNESHKKYTGVDNHEILNNLIRLIENHQNVHIRIPIIPSITDSEANLVSIKNYLKQVHFTGDISLLSYNTFGIRKYKQLGCEYRLTNLKPPTSERMQEIRNFFLKTFPNCKIGG